MWIHIPELKVYNEAFIGSESKLAFKKKPIVEIYYWCTVFMWKIVIMPIADWLPYPPPLFINIWFEHWNPKRMQKTTDTKVGDVKLLSDQSLIFMINNASAASDGHSAIEVIGYFWQERYGITSVSFEWRRSCYWLKILFLTYLGQSLLDRVLQCHINSNHKNLVQIIKYSHYWLYQSLWFKKE